MNGVLGTPARLATLPQQLLNEFKSDGVALSENRMILLSCL